MAGTPVMQATVSNSADAFNPSAKQKFLAETMNLPTSGTPFPAATIRLVRPEDPVFL